MATDDLTPILRQQPQPSAHFGQAKILGWDPETFESVVDWNGVRLRNLPVLAGAEALTFKPGQDVVLVGLDQGGRRGAQDWAIWTRAVVPGSGAAEAAIEWMTSALAKRISAEVFAARVHTDEVDDAHTISNQSTFGDLATVGPSVSDVEVSELAVVMMSCRIAGSLPATNGAAGGYMSVQVSGATSVLPDIVDSFHVSQTNNTSSGVNRSDGARGGAFRVIPLNTGVHTFTAKYRTLGSNSTTFGERSLVVIAL